MANLDTPAKRRSGLQQNHPYVVTLPGPDGTIALADRQHLAFSYSGIAVLPPNFINTAAKRASALQFLKPPFSYPVLPDGTLDQGDRQHIALLYRGILAAGAPGGGGTHRGWAFLAF